MESKINTGCKHCDKSFIENNDMCPKHKLEYLKWCVKDAQYAYMEELRLQSRKETENAKCK